MNILKVSNIFGNYILNFNLLYIFYQDERTALHECARSQCREELHLGEIARTLIEAGCDINSKSSDWGEVSSGS